MSVAEFYDYYIKSILPHGEDVQQAPEDAHEVDEYVERMAQVVTAPRLVLLDDVVRVVRHKARHQPQATIEGETEQHGGDGAHHSVLPVSHHRVESGGIE